MSGLPRPFCRAIHAGAKMIAMVIITHIVYLMISKILMCCSIVMCKKGRFVRPPSLFVVIINHILRICPVLLRYELTGYILPYGLCVTLSPFLFALRLLRRPSLR